MNQVRIPKQRAIIDRRALAERIATLAAERGDKARGAVVETLREALEQGREELRRRLEAKPHAGHECVAGHAFLIDQLVRLIHDHVTGHVYPAANRSEGERVAILAVGGYGRA